MTGLPCRTWEGALHRLDKLPRIWAGDEITCPRCSEQHITFAGRDPLTGTPTNVLFYTCGSHLHLAAVDGREMTHQLPTTTSAP